MNLKRKNKSLKQNNAQVKTNGAKKITRRHIVNTVCIVFLSSVLIISTFAFVLLQDVLNNASLISGIEGLSSKNSTRIYATNGELIASLSGGDGLRENIKYEQIPQNVVDAFLAVEDSRFFKHNGFDLARFIKAGFENVKAGGLSQGGSTLTMQLIDVASERNSATQSTKEKLEQKVQEIFKSMEIESDLSKDQILENYLNMINFGGTARGIQKGAQYYFGKDVQNISLSEAAFLAGVINAPGSNNPYTDNIMNEDGTVKWDYYKAAIQRRDDALSLMYRHGYITKTELDSAISIPLAFQLNGEAVFNKKPYDGFIDAAIKEVERKTGKNPATTPMDIYLTMDKEAQELADQISDHGAGAEYPDDRFQTGFTAMDNQTGAILAVGPGRGYESGTEARNRAMVDKHQIGSTSKPLVDYALAFEELGISTEHEIMDEKMPFGAAGNYLNNFDGNFSNTLVPLKKAVGSSLNTTAYKTYLDVVNKIGNQKFVDYVNKMGFNINGKNMTIDDLNGNYAIGGSTFEATPTELAAAYSIFANKGDYIEPYMVSKVVFQGDDDTPDYVATQEKQKVFSSGTAYLMSYILQDSAQNTAYGNLVAMELASLGYPIYGKSGTTDWGKDGLQFGYPEGVAKDKWMVAYTNQYTVAAWAGYDGGNANEANYLTKDQIFANHEGKTIKAMLTKLNEGKTVAEIPRPDDVVSITHVKGVFPYAKANDGTEMVTGWINKKFAGALKDFAADPLPKPASFDVTSENGVLHMTIAAFPDATKLGEENNARAASFGLVQYQYEITVNGKSQGVQTLPGTSGTATIDAKESDSIEVCGFYGYSISSVKSDKICKTVKGSANEVTYQIQNDFTRLFSGNVSFEERRTMINTFMASKMPDIKFTIQSNPQLDAGTLDPASTLREGIKVSSKGGPYVISIGSKP